MLAVIVTASARLPSTLARQAAGGFGHRGEAILSDRSAAFLTGSVRTPVTQLSRMPGLLLGDGSHPPDRLVRFLGAHPLRGVRVSEAPAHDYIVPFAVALAVPGRLAKLGSRDRRRLGAIGRRGSRRQVWRRVDWLLVDPKLEVKVRAGRVAG